MASGEYDSILSFGRLLRQNRRKISFQIKKAGSLFGVPAFVSFEVFMKITKIEPQKKHKNRMSVFLDDMFAFGIDAFSLYALKLKENDEIDEIRLREIKNTVLFESAKTYAANLVSARSYTERGMKQKLMDHTGDEATANKVLAFLKEYKLIDDSDYARRFASDCLNLKKYGRRKIKYKLLEKGIPAEIAENAIEELDCNDVEAENLEKLMQKKLGGDFDMKNVMRAKRYFAARGYSFDDIDSTLRKLKAESEDGYSC